MVKKISKFLLGLASLTAFGCASTMNPYSENFTCPISEQGKCVPIQQAYQESVQNYKITLNERTERNDLLKQDFAPVEDVYKDALFNKLSQLLKDPKSPILAPPKIVRVMILPYQGENGKEFYSARYVYVLVEEPQWILQNLTSMPQD